MSQFVDGILPTSDLSFLRCICCCLTCFSMLLLFSLCDRLVQRICSTFQKRLEHFGDGHLFCEDVLQHRSCGINSFAPSNSVECAVLELELDWSPMSE